MSAPRTVKPPAFLAVILTVGLVLGFATGEKANAQDESDCITCHATETPGTVEQWLQSEMSAFFDCSMCHGSTHVSNDDVAQATLPTPSTCGLCHKNQIAQYQEGKHALAWNAMQATPFVPYMPPSLGGADGFKGCSGCHKIGEKTQEELQSWSAGYGSAACDSCHTRHVFSKVEAQDPRACQLCHIGFDHPQWESWSLSKHGTIWAIEEGSGRTPTCQNCHLPNGTHTNITPWGFLALRAYAENDPEWQADREIILTALGVFDAQGNPTERLDLVVNAKIARTTEEEFMAIRSQITAVCGECHTSGFITQQINASDDLIRRADHMMAEAITVVNGLYKDGLLNKPQGWDYAPDLLQFYNAASNIENELFTMFLEYRQRTFVGAFHANPDYTYWYGYASMQRSLQKIHDEAELIRATKPGTPLAHVIGYAALGVGSLALIVCGVVFIRRR